jgi:hypothetical protein
MASKPFRFDRKDGVEIGKVMAVAGISAALVAGLQFLGEQDLGSWSPIITAVLTVAIKALQQWSGDNSKSETRR